MNIDINPKVKAFEEQNTFIGWYFDTNGNYCGIVGKYLFCIFTNKLTEELELTITNTKDIFDSNPIQWITIEDMSNEEIWDFIANFIERNC